MQEEWKPIPGFDYYEASSLGNIRSIDRSIELKIHGCDVKRSMRGITMRTFKQNGGYLFVVTSEKGKRRNKTVHDLVASAFIGARPQGYDVNHIDGDKTNNSPSNLEYVTRKENMLHAREIGIWDNRGQNNGQAKATEDQIRDAHYIVSCGISQERAAQITGLTRSQVRKAVSGEKWKHLGLPVLTKKRNPQLSALSEAHHG